MSLRNSEPAADKTPLERLVDVADAMFERANKLDGIKLTKKDEEAEATIRETRDDAFSGCIQAWKVIMGLLPTADLDTNEKRRLTQDAWKVISRCYHRLGNLERAKVAISKSIDEGYLDGFISLGAICLDLGDYEGSEASFKSALTKGAQETRAHAGLGELYFVMGTEKKKTDPSHTEYFTRAEEEFILAGKARFAGGFERAMDLFEAMGWKDKAVTIGEKAARFYEEHRVTYGERLTSLDSRLRKLAGDERHAKIVQGLGRKLGTILGGKPE